MEFTSQLAGEPKSDGPRCTDPLLAALARAVNDFTSDGNRQRLVGFAPDLVEAHPGDDAVRRTVARRCLLTALPYTAGSRRFVLAVALLGIDRAAAGASRGWTSEMFDADTEWALLDDKVTTEGAAEFVAPLRSARDQHTVQGLPAAVETAVASIAESATDADEVLYRLLGDCLRDFGRVGRRTAEPRYRVS